MENVYDTSSGVIFVDDLASNAVDSYRDVRVAADDPGGRPEANPPSIL